MLYVLCVALVWFVEVRVLVSFFSVSWLVCYAHVFPCALVVGYSVSLLRPTTQAVQLCTSEQVGGEREEKE